MFIEQPDGLQIETVFKSYGLSANSFVTSARQENEKHGAAYLRNLHCKCSSLITGNYWCS